MRSQLGLAGVTAALIVAVAILLPPREPRVSHAYRDMNAEATPAAETLDEIARLQARLAGAPDDHVTADRLSEILSELGQTDDALRIAGAAADRGGPGMWRSQLAIAAAHAKRIEFDSAHEWTLRAIATCTGAGDACPGEERVRMDLFLGDLERGRRAIAEGVDPRLEPTRFRERIQRSRPPIQIRP